MKGTIRYSFFVWLLLVSGTLLAQRPAIRLPGGLPTGGFPRSGNTGNRSSGDSSQREGVEHRDYSDDSLVVKVYRFNTVRPTTFDTSIRDYSLRFPIPATHYYLGNDGSATKSLLFVMPSTTGWDPGFHSHDVYKFKLENARFYNTPRPYTELGYMLATGTEQMIEVLHTQNVKPNWNVSFQYRLLTAPGIFRNQRNNHSNIQLGSWYQSTNRRYNNYFVFLQNSINAGESGGLRTDKDYLDDPTYARRFTIPTFLGGSPSLRGGAFNNSFVTGRRERENHFYLRQQYDFGRKDSLVTDSTVIPLFYPRVRFEHSFRFATYNYSYKDEPSSSSENAPDSTYYDSLYRIRLTPNDTLNPVDSVFIQDRWREISNDFSIYQFPDANNLQQFIKLGAELQLLKGYFAKGVKSYTNVIGHGEYRNRTRNQKWDINAFGRLYLAGLNFGDYHAYVSLQRLLSQQLGSLQLGFENINRSPSFIYNQQSSFYLDTAKNFSKENTLHFFGSYYLPKLDVQLRGDYYVVSNFLYLNGYRSLQQENALFNVLRVSGLKTFRIGRHWNLYSELYVQQKAGGAEVNLPLLYTRNQLAFEGRFFRNLNLSTGLEIRYNTPYKMDMYSPVLGQFFYQDSTTISNRPEIHAFLHMRVRTFKAFIRLENLNTANLNGGFAFDRHNLAAIGYPTPGMVFRFGIYWVFVN
ncbi:putative porin [Flavisolibacter nicotianae]|uniref:putative porin n=1 Tax=Flavisolibacter nicotianae TaxID=2364882 RepID=UPI000EB5A707|nr:putative porin [Flavisolibacter nicotianae]